MIVYAIGLPLLILAAVFDASVLVQLRYLEGQPSLTLMLIVSWALLNELPDALPWAVMGGIFTDVLSLTPMGTSSLAFAMVMIITSGLFGRVGSRNLIFPPLAIAIGTLLYHAIALALLFASGWTFSIVGALLRWTVPSLIMNLVGMFVIFRVTGRIVEFFRPPVVAP